MYNGSSFSPFTSIFENCLNETSYFKLQKLTISSFDPGAWLPNWLQGKSSISNPSFLYSLYNFSSPSYWGVNPHPVAVLTISKTLPSNSFNKTSSPLISLTLKS